MKLLMNRFALTKIVHERAYSGIRISMPGLRLRQVRNDAN